MVQTVNDSVSYVFYRLTAQVLRDKKHQVAKEIDAATYLMVKNEREFYKAFFYLPPNLISKNPIDDTPELIMKNFTGKLLLSNLEIKQSFILDYKNGSVSDSYRKKMLTNKKLLAVGASTSFYETHCETEMVGCTYVTTGYGCWENIVIAYSWNCEEPTWCYNVDWILTNYSTQYVCVDVWFPDPPIDPGSGGGDGGDAFGPENPTEDEYTLTVIADSINLSNRFDCFDNLPTNYSKLYSVKICADIPNNAKPDDLTHEGSPGHAFLELTKTTDGVSVTQTIGFYPANYHTAKLQVNVASMVVDNKNHDYDASLTKMLNVIQFNAMLAAALPAAAHQYNMGSYNCTNFALDIFNSQGYSLYIPDTYNAIWNYGKTPNALYKDIKNKYNNEYPGANPASGKGIVSTNCN